MPVSLGWVPPRTAAEYKICAVYSDYDTGKAYLHLELRTAGSGPGVKIMEECKSVEGVLVHLYMPVGPSYTNGVIIWDDAAFVAFVQQQWTGLGGERQQESVSTWMSSDRSVAPTDHLSVASSNQTGAGSGN